MSVDRDELIKQVRTGSYLPQAILGVEISKENGKYRLLGIPTLLIKINLVTKKVNTPHRLQEKHNQYQNAKLLFCRSIMQDRPPGNFLQSMKYT
jgi:hypothetical protein